MWATSLVAMIIPAMAEGPPAADKQQDHFLVGFAQDNMSLTWRAHQVFALEAALKKHDSIEFIFTDAQGSAAKAVSDIESLVDRGVDLLVVSPQSSALATPVITSVYQSGVPVVLLTRHIMNESYTSFIAPDDYTIAKQAADEVAAALNGQGNVLVIRGVPSASTVAHRTSGFFDQIKAYPGLNISAMIDGDYSQVAAMKAMIGALDTGIPFDAIFAQSDEMAEGARLVLQSNGIDPRDIPIIGIDYTSQAQDAIRNGTQTASFLYPLCSAEAAVVIWDILTGKPVKKNIVVNSQKITLNNVNSVTPVF